MGKTRKPPYGKTPPNFTNMLPRFAWFANEQNQVSPFLKGGTVHQVEDNSISGFLNIKKTPLKLTNQYAKIPHE